MSSSYRAVLRQPQVLRAYSAATVARTSYGIVSLSLLVAASRATSYAWAAGSVAGFGLAAAFLAPVRARLLDRHGSRRVLPVLAGSYTAMLVALTVTTWRPGAPVGLLLALSVAAGAVAPPFGPVMRALWSEAMPDDRLRQRAFALDTVVEELIFVVGPLAAGIFIALGCPALGVGTSAALIAIGTAAFVTSPLVASPLSEDVRPAVRESGPRDRPSGLFVPIVVAIGAGVALGVLELLTVVAAEDRGHPAAVAWLQAAFSLGSAVGGIGYGAHTWKSPARRRLPLLAFGLGLATAACAPAANLWVLGVTLGVAGLFIAPTLSTAYLVADERATTSTRVRAGTWVNSALNLGTSGGTAGAGVLVGGLALPWCFAVAAAPALAAAAVTTIGRRRSPALASSA